jgi:hypothetical protein
MKPKGFVDECIGQVHCGQLRKRLGSENGVITNKTAKNLFSQILVIAGKKPFDTFYFIF